VLLFLLAALLPLHAADTNVLLTSWLNSQTNLHTWSADLTQTRSLKALAEPLVSTGRVWFAAPDRFRWELGSPAQTIAVRNGAEMFLVTPRLKRADRIPLDGSAKGPWSEVLALLESGFPRDAAAFFQQYQLKSLRQTNDVCEVRLLPKSTGARRMIPEVMVAFSTNGFGLLATELTLADGSVMRNDFHNTALNPVLDADTFKPPITPEFKITEPWKNRP
jgi:outer membrane lipoprotein carrier protein